jgi:beta-lactamase regulating signal transducer with metallopeptidase domain/protein involved in polysaccharide export with SLBB domain
MNTLLEIGLTNALLATMLALVVVMITRLWRHPSIAHALWLLVLVKLVTPPLVNVSWQWPSTDRAPEASVETSGVETAAFDDASVIPLPAPAQWGEPAQVPADSPWRDGPALVANDVVSSAAPQPAAPAAEPAPVAAPAPANTPWFRPSWPIGIFALWVTGSAITLMVAAARLIGFHFALLKTAPAADDLVHLAETAAARLGVRRPFRLRITEARLAPFVWPLGRPMIVLSRPLVDGLSPADIQTLLAHEFAHLKRKDHWVRWFELVVTVLYWWHPVLWWARTMIHRAEERLCDAWTVWAFPEDARRYAGALFQAIQFTTETRRAVPLVASRLTPGGDLKERIEQIMNAKCKRTLSRPAWLAVLVSAVAVLPMSLRAQQTGPVESDGVEADSHEVQANSAASRIHSNVPDRPGSLSSEEFLRSLRGSQLPIGMRREIAKVRHGELLLAREIQLLEDVVREANANFRELLSSDAPLHERETAAAEMAVAQGRLALARRDIERAIERFAAAAQSANGALVAATEARLEGNATEERVLAAAEKASEVREQLLAAREQTQAVVEPGEATPPANTTTVQPRSPSADFLRASETALQTRGGLDFLRERVDTLEKLVNAMVAMKRGSPEDVALAKCALAMARSDLAAAEGKYQESQVHLETAHGLAAKLIEEVRPVESPAYVQAVNKLGDVWLRMARIRTAMREGRQNAQSAEVREVPTAGMPGSDRIAPGQTIRISAIGVLPDAPIWDNFVVEPSGTVALGPQYGRVKVAGLTFEEAEQAIKKHLAQKVGEVEVQVTLAAPAGRQAVIGSGRGLPSASTTFGGNIARELAQLITSHQPGDSVGVLKSIAAAKQYEYALLKQASEATPNTVTTQELVAKKSEAEVSLARLKQAEQRARQLQLIAKLALNELDRAHKANQEAPGSVSESELQRLEILVELADAKYFEMEK